MSNAEGWHRDTALIRSGVNRTEHQETSEALFMTSGYVYKTHRRPRMPLRIIQLILFIRVMATLLF